MENVLNAIHGKFIRLSDEEVQINKEILESVVAIFVEKLKRIDPLFNKLFRRVFYGGSFYDGLRVGKPSEFDLDFLLDISQYGIPVITESEVDGFVYSQVYPFDKKGRVEPNPPYAEFKRKLLDSDNYLSTTKVLKWMESILQLCLNDFIPHGGGFYLLQIQRGTLKIKSCKAGPAFTLQIVGEGVNFHVDLVACFVFTNEKWPIGNYRSNPFPSKLNEFFIAPKPIKKHTDQTSEKYWRLSFQEQERELLKNKLRLKPAVRLLKKLRDTKQHKQIASYYIKTMFLIWVDQKEREFWNMPLSYIFMTVLDDYCKIIETRCLPYYWNRHNNLLENVQSATLQNYAGCLRAIIKDIQRNPENPEILLKCLLTAEERNKWIGSNAQFMEYEGTGADPVQQTQSNQSQCKIL